MTIQSTLVIVMYKIILIVFICLSIHEIRMLFFPINFKFLGTFKKQRMILSEVLSFYLVKIFNINVLFLYFYQFHAHLYVLINYSHMYFMGETI